MRTCHLKCDRCGATSQRHTDQVVLACLAVEAGWAVNRFENKDECPTCRARPRLETWQPPAPRPAAPPAEVDLTWEDGK